MNCEEFWNRMAELESDSAGSDQLGAEGDRHAAACAACAARLKRERWLSGGLRLLAAELDELAAPQRVEARLLATFRATHGIGASRPAVWWKATLAPWAAAGVLAAGLAVTALIAPKRPVATPAARHTAPARIELAALTTQESDDGFIPLPNAPQIDPNDDVSVVRMEFPRSAMLAVGLEVNPDQVSDTVEAEVKLGSDGLARAVRFME
jgi:hypothetical protein